MSVGLLGSFTSGVVSTICSDVGSSARTSSSPLPLPPAQAIRLIIDVANKNLLERLKNVSRLASIVILPPDSVTVL
ncbi:hypothetical protein D3C72_982790 [compost metagenome]